MTESELCDVLAAMFEGERDALDDAIAELDSHDDVSPYVSTRDLRGAGYFTHDTGIEVTLPDGSVFVVKVKRVSR